MRHPDQSNDAHWHGADAADTGRGERGHDNFEIRAGLETICTFTDAKQAGSIQVVKNTVGGIAGQTYTFGFTPSGFASNTPFNVQTTLA